MSKTNLKIKLISHTPDAEKIIASSARLCYSPVGVEEIQEGLTQEKIDKFLNHLIEIGHESPLEHCSFSFAVEGVSRALTHQLVRHRIASYSQQSQRYVKLDQFQYIIPPEIDKIPQAREIYIQSMENAQKSYDELVEILTNKYISTFISKGTEIEKAEKLAEKKAIEDSRYVFPNACESKIMLTMNIRSLINFFRHRCCFRSQWEIRQLAMQMLKECKRVCPTIFKNIGSPCVMSGICKEGSMQCEEMKGKIPVK